jgi:hypothetical protein
VQKHSETALDTPKNEGTESSFPIKMHLIVQHKAWPSVKSHGFTDEAVKMTVPSVKWQVFTDDLKKQVLIAPSGAATMVQNPKEKSQILENKRFAICNVPGAGVAKWVSRQICEIKLKFTKY